MSTEGTNLLQFKSSLATCLLSNFERGPSSILVTFKLKVLVPRYLPVYYVHFPGFRVWWKVSSAWTFFAKKKKKKKHLQQHSHLVKNKMKLFAIPPPLTPPGVLEDACRLPRSQGIHGEVIVQSLSSVQLFATAWTAARQASLSFTISQSLLKLTSI